jgi:hypothetical protein
MERPRCCCSKMQWQLPMPLLSRWRTCRSLPQVRKCPCQGFPSHLWMLQRIPVQQPRLSEWNRQQSPPTPLNTARCHLAVDLRSAPKPFYHRLKRKQNPTTLPRFPPNLLHPLDLFCRPQFQLRLPLPLHQRLHQRLHQLLHLYWKRQQRPSFPPRKLHLKHQGMPRVFQVISLSFWVGLLMVSGS